MYFRFGSAIFLVVLISISGIAIEKQNLAQRRELSRRHYQMDVLRDEHTRLRLHCQQLASIERLYETVDGKTTKLVPPQADVDSGESPRTPGTISKHESSPEDVITKPAPNDRNKSFEKKRRVPLLFFQRPAFDPRTKKLNR